MMMRLGVEAGELETAAAHAVELGATVADHRPRENVRVLYDPAGHPFCLYRPRVLSAEPLRPGRVKAPGTFPE